MNGNTLNIIIALFIILLDFRGVDSGYLSNSAVQRPWITSSMPEPEFEKTPQDIITTPGQTVVLPCRVRNLSDKLVSWLKKKGPQIISSGPMKFTTDSRFNVLHPDGDSAAWGMQIRNVNYNDSGTFICQLNTDPAKKREIQLKVTDRSVQFMELIQRDDSNAYGTYSATIKGSKEKKILRGTKLYLECEFAVPTVNGEISSPIGRNQLLVQWLHNDRAVNPPGGRMDISTTKDGSHVLSTLTLSPLQDVDAGKYTCQPYHSKETSVVVHVIEALGHQQSFSAVPSLYQATNPALLAVLSSLTLISRN